MIRTILNRSMLFGLTMVFAASMAFAQTTEFTYQGNLTNGGTAASGNFDFQFLLYDAVSAGNQIGSTIPMMNLTVTNGLFSVNLDFGDEFPGANRFLEINVRQTGGGPFTTLAPRQQINSAPYSIKSLSAETSVNSINATQLGGVEAGQFVVTSDFRLSNERAPAPGSQNYIQNNSVIQNLAEFNVGGTGRAANFDTPNGYLINGLRVLGTTGNSGIFVGPNSGINNIGGANTFVGSESGAGNTSGGNNTFVGFRSGNANQTGGSNSFFGYNSGSSNIGVQNSFFGSTAGQNHTSGINNSFFGERSGFNSTTASGNSFFGTRAGFSTTEGGSNSFFGVTAGVLNTTGSQNIFVGFQAGFNNLDGSRNVFLGWNSGFASVSGINNTFIGQSSGIGNETGSHNAALGSGSGFTQPGLTFATAIGPGTRVSTNNTIQLGRITQEELVLIPGDLQVNGNFTGSFSVPAANITGILQPSNGGTGLNSAGLAGAFLRSNGATWTSSALLASDLPFGSSKYIQNSTNLQAETANFNISGLGEANIFDARTEFRINGTRILSTPGPGNLLVGNGAGANPPTGGSNSFFGGSAGFATTSGASNTFIGSGAGVSNTTGNNNSALGRGANVGTGNLAFATAIGAGSVVNLSNSMVLGRANGSDSIFVPGRLSIGSTLTVNGLYLAAPDNGPSEPESRISIGRCNGLPQILLAQANAAPCTGLGLFRSGNNVGLTQNPSGMFFVGGGVTILPDQTVFLRKINGGILHLCYTPNTAPGGVAFDVVATCSSSIRYKSNVKDYRSGSVLLDRLRPVSFNWKNGGMLDLGLVAEEVAEIDPLLVTYNDKGEVEGVKYDRIGVVLINVLKEQQKQIEGQQKQIDDLKAMVCELKPNTSLCKKED